VSEEDVRERLRASTLAPSDADFAPTEPPSPEDGLELLPMFYDARSGPVALATALGGWNTLELAPEGGAVTAGVIVPPDRRPRLEPIAERLLEGYLHYFLERDCFLAAVHLEVARRPAGDVLDAARADLHAIGSDVIARGAIRAKLLGTDGARLSGADIERGIRATDQDWLDRPTWGERL